MKQYKRTPSYSYALGKLPKGCRLCVKGLKEVIFATGICRENCYFCPISDLKKGKDLVYANERRIRNIREIIEEARMCGSKGAGITGGDPLMKIKRTVKIIKLLKKKFGKDFHIHLYCPLSNLNLRAVKILEKAGLDEIRLHPNLDNSSPWEKIKIKTKMKKGIEIPVIPGKKRQILKLIRFAEGDIAFLNLNELEGADASGCKLAEMGYESAFEILEYCARNTRLNVHYCTTKTKDKAQLTNRIKRRAKNAKKEYDKLTKDWTFVRGAVCCKNPSIRKLNNLRNKLINSLNIKKELIEVDKVKLRLLTKEEIVRRNIKKLNQLNLSAGIVEEMPTFDEFEIASEDLI
ncbi:radical SAM protein [archaeon]|nr:radical SAM protein [archaeon]